MSNLKQWLTELNMPQYASALLRERVTSPQHIARMSDQQLEAAGVFLRGHRKRMLAGAQKYAAGGDAPPALAPKTGSSGNLPTPPPKDRSTAKLRGMPTAMDRQILRQSLTNMGDITQQTSLLPSMAFDDSQMDKILNDGGPQRAWSSDSITGGGDIDDLDAFLSDSMGDNDAGATKATKSFDFSKHQSDMLKDGDLDLDSLMEDLSALETDTAIFQEATVDEAHMGGLGGRMSYTLKQRVTPAGMVGGDALALVGSVEGNSYPGGQAAYGNIVLGPDQNAGVGIEPPEYVPYASKYVGKPHSEIEEATLALFKEKMDSTKTAHERLAKQAQAVTKKKGAPSAADNAAASSGLSNTAISKGNYQGLTNEQKFAMAMKKMEQATGLQTVVIKVSNFEGSEVSIPINTETSSRVLLGTLVKKFAMPPDPKYCLFEVIPSLRMERLVEDHENIFEINKYWGFTTNKFVFGISSFKPVRYDCDHWNLEWGPIRASAPIPLPPMEGLLHWAVGNAKGKKMKWRQNYFIVRDSGFWIPKDYKKDKAVNLTQFVKFEGIFCFIGMKPKELLGCPTDFCICLKPKRNFNADTVKYIALANQEEMMKWIITSRVGIFKGDVLRRNEVFYVEGQVIGSEEQSIYEANDKAGRARDARVGPPSAPSKPIPKGRPSQPTSAMPSGPPMPQKNMPGMRPMHGGSNPRPPMKGGDGPETPPKLSPKNRGSPGYQMNPPMPPKKNDQNAGAQPPLPSKGTRGTSCAKR